MGWLSNYTKYVFLTTSALPLNYHRQRAPTITLEFPMALCYAYGHALYHAGEDWIATDGSVQTTRQRLFALAGNATADPWVFHCRLPGGPPGMDLRKLIAWTNSYPWEDDEVLDSCVSIYWFSRAGPAASLRIYKEMMDSLSQPSVAGVKWTSIPFGYARFPKELNQAPKKWLKTLGVLVTSFSSPFTRTEDTLWPMRPEGPEELVARDIRNMLGRGGPAFGEAWIRLSDVFFFET